MSTTSPHAEQLPPAEWDSLLNFSVDDIEPLRQRLLGVSGDNLLSFVAVRKEGTSYDMLTTIYGTNLTDWHHENGRGGDAAADLEYEGGLLYGKTLAKGLYFSKTGHSLLPDDPDACRVAEQAVKRSYDEMPAECQTPWEQENFRELAFTGSHLLSVLNAVLDDHITEQMVSLYKEHGMGDGVVDESERVAFYRGLIDSVIFYNSYARWKDRTLGPESFIENAKRLLADRRRCAELAIKDTTGVVAEYSLDAGDDIAVFVAHLDRPFKGTEDRYIRTDGQAVPMVAVTSEFLRQTGPNTFVFRPELLFENMLDNTSDLESRMKVLHSVGRRGITSMMVMSGLGTVAQMHTAEIVRNSGLAASILGAIVGGSSLIYYRYKTAKFGADGA
jgi:hypothetical protein